MTPHPKPDVDEKAKGAPVLDPSVYDETDQHIAAENRADKAEHERDLMAAAVRDVDAFYGTLLDGWRKKHAEAIRLAGKE